MDYTQHRAREFNLETHNNELIERLGNAIKRINELEERAVSKQHEWAEQNERASKRITDSEALLRKLVEACDSEGSQDAFGYIAVDVADEARELLK